MTETILKPSTPPLKKSPQKRSKRSPKNAVYARLKGQFDALMAAFETVNSPEEFARLEKQARAFSAVLKTHRDFEELKVNGAGNMINGSKKAQVLLESDDQDDQEDTLDALKERLERKLDRLAHTQRAGGIYSQPDTK